MPVAGDQTVRAGSARERDQVVVVAIWRDARQRRRIRRGGPAAEIAAETSTSGSTTTRTQRYQRLERR